MPVILCYMPTPGGLTGGPRRLLTLCEELRERGIGVCLASDTSSDLLTEARDMDIPVCPMALPKILRIRKGGLFGGGLGFRIRVLVALLKQNLRFAHAIQNLGTNSVWIRGSKGVAFAALGAWLSRHPVIWDVDYELPSRGAVRWLHQIGLSLSDCIVFQYPGAGEAIFGKKKARMYHKKMRALIPGVALDRLHPYRALRIQRQRSGVFRILQVGTICDRKNQMLMIQALGEAKAKQWISLFRIYFAGDVFDEPYRKALIREINRLDLQDHAVFLGWRDDVHQLMADSDILVMPSKDEGVPNAVQEAMYIGMPVIVSQAGGMPAIVGHERTGWVLPSDAPEQWAQQMTACAKDEKRCKAIGEAASAYARTHFGTREWGMRYAEIIRNTAGVRSGNNNNNE